MKNLELRVPEMRVPDHRENGGLTALHLPGASRRNTLRRRLLNWYEKNRRALPWRDTGDPYRVLVSEFMLQQTQVSTVLPYFERFLNRFPDLDALASSTEDAVCAAWSGLGYYRRARSLRATARSLVRHHGGRLPADPGALRELPGVGEYTAAALASIVHDAPAAVVDGNVLRVMARMFGIADSISRPAGKRKVSEAAAALLDRDRPGDWNQAVMELGATVCTPRAPRCDACPWSKTCVARAAAAVERYPVKDPPPPSIIARFAVGVFRRGHHVLLTRRDDPKLLTGTWELPGLDLAGARAPRPALAGDLEHRFHRPVSVGAELVRVRHSITRRRITVMAFAAGANPSPRARAGARAWISPGSLGDYPVSSMTSKVLRELLRLSATS